MSSKSRLLSMAAITMLAMVVILGYYHTFLVRVQPSCADCAMVEVRGEIITRPQPRPDTTPPPRPLTTPQPRPDTTPQPPEMIPNIVHYVRFDQPNLSFVELLCILSAHEKLKPDRIIIHTNTVPSTGKYWKYLRTRVPELTFRQRERPKKIFGRDVNVVQHASDFVRIQVLISDGGIYLDNDVYVVNSFDRYRKKSKCSIGWPMDLDKNAFIGNQIFICPANDQFMTRYLETYKTKFDDDKWYYNAGEVPSVDILKMKFNTSIINAVPDSQFAVNTGHIGRIFNEAKHRDRQWRWKSYYAIHLLYQHRSYMVKEEYEKYGEYDEDKINHTDNAFGEMARLIYYGQEFL